MTCYGHSFKTLLREQKGYVTKTADKLFLPLGCFITPQIDFLRTKVCLDRALYNFYALSVCFSRGHCLDVRAPSVLAMFFCVQDDQFSNHKDEIVICKSN